MNLKLCGPHTCHVLRRPNCNNGKYINNINSTAECAQACCDHKAANPFSNDACTAWSLNGWGQCFWCASAGNQTAVAVPTNCSHRVPCATGVVTLPTPPPLPPAPLTGHLGGEASVEYVDYGRLLRWPSHLNGGKAFDQDELTPLGWPKADCQICVFDGRPTGVRPPPLRVACPGTPSPQNFVGVYTGSVAPQVV